MSTARDLESAICLLALTAKSSPHPEEATSKAQTTENEENSYCEFIDDGHENPNDAAMTVRQETESQVKIFCAKNEGIYKKDATFLEEWKSLMECVARKGSSQVSSGIVSHTNFVC
jgi:hypothetical protein